MCLVTGKESIQQEALASCPRAPPQGPVTQAPRLCSCGVGTPRRLPSGDRRARGGPSDAQASGIFCLKAPPTCLSGLPGSSGPRGPSEFNGGCWDVRLCARARPGVSRPSCWQQLLEQELGIGSYLDSISPGPYRMVGPHPGPPQLQPPIKYSEQASERD